MPRVWTVLEALKVEHTVFALPFAYLGMLLGASSRGAPPTLREVVLVTVALAGARTFAMAANRIVDREIDARNPRTANRALPQGRLRVRDLALVGLGGLGIMLLAAWQLNVLCLALAPLAVAVLAVYPYTKRFTWLSHAILGLADGAAPLGGWMAVTGAIGLEGVLLALAVACWVGGFDLIYACLDVDFDRQAGLHSVPARFGVATALHLSTLAHLATLGLLAVVGRLMGLGVLYWLGLAVAAGLFVYEHAIVRPDDLSRVDVAFFNVNGYIAIVVFLATAGALYVPV